MRSIVLLLFLIGVIFIVIGYAKTNIKCPPPQIEYRFIPRNFYEEQLQPNNIMSQFNDMFVTQEPNNNYQNISFQEPDVIDQYNSFFKVVQ